MGVFADWAHRYHELGINVLPIAEDKKPPANFRFQRFLKERQSIEDIDSMVEQYGHLNGIAWVMGEVSGIIAFDFDYAFDPDRCKLSEEDFKKDFKPVDKVIRQTIPISSLQKVGKKGWNNFYKWSPQFEKTIPCMRNGVQLFDLKATGYVVVPPSDHSTVDGVVLKYQWTIGDPEDDIGNLPILDRQLVIDIHGYLGGGKSSSAIDKTTRHGRLFTYALSMARLIDSSEKLAELIIQKDIELHTDDKKGLYCADKKHNPSGNAEKFASSWAERILSFSQSKAQSKAPVDEIEMFNYFYDNLVIYGKPRKDFLSHKVFYPSPVKKNNAAWTAGDELIEALVARALAEGLDGPQNIKRQFSRYQVEKPDLELLVDIPKWDGKDRLRIMTDCIETEYYTQDDVYQIFKVWGFKMFKRIYEDDFQNECVILKGKQGIGKDTWIKALVSGFGHYYQGIEVSDIDEMLPTVQKVFVAHLEEFDRTKKIDVSELKALITKPSSFFREKYGRTAMQRPMKASWLSSVNVDDFFRDTTGNRRFVVIPILNIKRDYPGNESPQLIAQFKEIKDAKISDALAKKISDLNESLTPDDPSEMIDELIRNALKEHFKAIASLYDPKGTRTKRDRIPCSEMVEEWLKISRLQQVSVKRIQSCAKKYQLHSGGKWYVESKLEAIEKDLK